MKNEGHELPNEPPLVHLFRTTDLFLKFLDGVAIEVGNEEVCIVFLKEIVVISRILDHIFDGFFGCYLLIGISIHLAFRKEYN